MKLEQLQLLIDIVECGSMNEAAKKNYIARSSVSTSMKNLENELGGTLFRRSSRGTVLTPFGAEVYDQARGICAKLDFLRNSPETSRAEKLTITSLYCSLAYKALIVLFKNVDPRYFSASIQENGLLRSIDMVSRGIADLGVVSLFHGSESIAETRMENAGVLFHPLTERRLYAVVGTRNPFFSKDVERVSLEDLSGFPYFLNYDSVTEFSMERFMEKRDPLRSVIQVTDLACALRLVAETDGVLIETDDRELYREFYQAEGLRFIPMSDESMKCTLGWISRKDTRLSEVARHYIEIMDDLIHEMCRNEVEL